MNKFIITLAVAALALGAFAQENDSTAERGRMQGRGGSRERGKMQANPDAKLHRFSTTIEKERPQLNQEMKDLIAAYRRNPSDANYAAPRRVPNHARPVRVTPMSRSAPSAMRCDAGNS